MRDRRWRRLVDTDGNQQRKAVGATGGGVSGWLRENIGKSLIGGALVAVFAGWLTGFFDSILDQVAPSGADAACALRETIQYNWPFAT
jgi:hypothetical protein